jgi:hypothetical protein
MCFSFQESWVPRHTCARKDKIGKPHYSQVYSDSDSDDKDEKHEQEHQT